MVILNDKRKTRVRPQNVTSYYEDSKISGSSCIPTIKLTVESAHIELVYDTSEARDLDIGVLDETTKDEILLMIDGTKQRI